MRRLPYCVLSLAVAACLGAGCKLQQRLDRTLTVSVSPGETKPTKIDAPIADQQVTVTADSPGVPVSVYLVLEKDRTSVEDALFNSKRPEKALDGKDKVEQATLQGTVAAKNDFAVVIWNPGLKPATVKLTISGR
jgi:hypothetical protein